MRRITKVLFALVITAHIAFSGCQNHENSQLSKNKSQPYSNDNVLVEAEYLDAIKSVDHLLEQTSTVADFEILSVSDFNEYKSEYEIRINHVYWGSENSENPLFLYASKNRYDVGSKYLGFLKLGQINLYPSVTAIVIRDAAFDVEAEHFELDEKILAQSKEQLLQMLEKSPKKAQTFNLQKPRTLQSLLATEPEFAEVTLISELNANKYVSTYEADVSNLSARNSSQTVRMLLTLPPGLPLDKEQIMFFEKDTDGSMNVVPQKELIFPKDHLPNSVNNYISD